MTGQDLMNVDHVTLWQTLSALVENVAYACVSLFLIAYVFIAKIVVPSSAVWVLLTGPLYLKTRDPLDLALVRLGAFAGLLAVTWPVIPLVRLWQNRNSGRAQAAEPPSGDAMRGAAFRLAPTSEDRRSD